MGRIDIRTCFIRALRLGPVFAIAAACAGCFQPLYGESSVGGRPAVKDALGGIDIKQIDAAPNTAEARLAVQIRNELLFSFNGGGSSGPITHRLDVKIGGSRSIISIDSNSALPNVEAYNLSTTYTLTDLATNTVVVTGRARTSVSYDTLGQQRFARISGMHDAEKRAAKVISDNITTRMASYFVSGT
jgi:LPS-assembly lipoprotein